MKMIYLMNFYFAAGEIAGKITLKHVYEIAKIKKEDYCNSLKSMEEMVKMIAYNARSCGVEIVRELNKEEFIEFRKKAAEVRAQHDLRLQEAKEAKMLRTKVE